MKTNYARDIFLLFDNFNISEETKGNKNSLLKRNSGFSRMNNDSNSGAWVLIGEAYKFLINGELDKGEKIVTKLIQMNIPDSEMKYRFSHFYILLNDKEKALKALDEAVDGGFFCYNYIS